MSSPSDVVATRALLHEWGLPDPGDSKDSRGEAIVVGGSRRSPGAVLLAGEAALRTGAGRVALVVPASIEPGLGLAMPEAAVLALPARAVESRGGPRPLGEEEAEAIRSADAVLVGPGITDADDARAAVLAVAEQSPRLLVLDAFALGVLPDLDRAALPDALVLNPNQDEAAILLGREPDMDATADLVEIARRFDAVVNCYGRIAAPAGGAWHVREGGAGLGTAGSGDVLAGAITGFAARGQAPERAAVWGSWAHARAGDRLTERIGLGFLARELPAELTAAIAEVTAPQGR
jgi:hydroxyethylthiazole kinase-like uncharacterized protein yjeF